MCYNISLWNNIEILENNIELILFCNDLLFICNIILKNEILCSNFVLL